MKKIFSIILLYTFLSSCTPDTPEPPTNNSVIGPQPTFQFKVNGVVKNCDAIFNSLIGWDKCPIIQYYGLNSWELTGISGRSSNLDGEGIQLEMSGSPAVNTFSSTDEVLRVGNTFYTIGSCTVTLTSISNNRATGTFSGQLRTSNGSVTALITEGVFSNVPVGNFDWGIRQ